MELIRDVKGLNKSDTDIAGGKGASLGEMMSIGLLVPSGFVVLTIAFERFLQETQLREEIEAQLDKLDYHKIESVNKASEIIRSLILEAQMPQDIKQSVQQFFKDLNTEFVAVRSSATAEDGISASWAGELDSFLNATQDDLIENIQRCWASLFTPRAIFYRNEKGFKESEISVAVIIQKMINSEVSGISFSVHPVTKEPNQVIIESGYGLGEAIVSGEITPDSYVVNKDNWEIIDSYISKQERKLIRKDTGGNEWVEVEMDEQGLQKISQKTIVELARLVTRIEKHYGFPCDVEWSLEDNQLYIVQSRPITTLKG